MRHVEQPAGDRHPVVALGDGTKQLARFPQPGNQLQQ
jgi:hypothetical protein